MALDLLGIFIADLLFVGLIFLYIWLTLRYRRAGEEQKQDEHAGGADETASAEPDGER